MPSSTATIEARSCIVARRFIVLALRGAIGLENNAGFAEFPELSTMQISRAIDIIRRNKIGGLVRGGARRLGLPVNPELGRFLDAEQQATIAKNMENLIETAKVAAMLGHAGINLIVMKGPVRSYEVFGALDARPSNDIDILVGRTDYERAGEVLCENGYVRGVPQHDRWWHEHLGEAPFVPTRSRCIVDVHHKVQQPGGPSPRDVDSFLADRRVLSVANHKFSVLQFDHALLLTYISVSKAMRNGEFWLGQAAEIALIQGRLSQAERDAFYAVANHHGLFRMLTQIDEVIACIFELTPQLTGTQGQSGRARALAAAAFGTPPVKKARLHRSRLLWQWTQGTGFQRAARFLGMTTERVLSDRRRPRSKPPAPSHN